MRNKNANLLRLLLSGMPQFLAKIEDLELSLVQAYHPTASCRGLVDNTRPHAQFVSAS